MLSEISVRKLTIFVIILVVTSVSLLVYDTFREKRTFKSSLGLTDTASITQILLYPKVSSHKEIKLTKDSGIWHVISPSGKSYSVLQPRISDILQTLSHLDVKRLVSIDKAKWRDYDVDTAATRIKIFSGESQKLDLMIGRFTVQQPREISTNLRLFGDAETYCVEGFLEATFNQPWYSFRNGRLLTGTGGDIVSISYEYPGDSSFVLENKNTAWKINGELTDSSKIVSYLTELMNLTSNSFLDDFSPNPNEPAKYRVRIKNRTGGEAALNRFDSNGQIGIYSTINDESYFDGKADELTAKIFKNKNYFLKK